MNHPEHQLHKIFLVLAALFTAAVLPASAGAEVRGVWRQHPGAALTQASQGYALKAPYRGKRYSYFIERGRSYLPGDGTGTDVYSTTECLYPFRYDSEHPDKGIYPLADDFELSGMRLQDAAYSPAAGRLVLAYPEGNFDIVYDSGELKRCDGLRLVASPGGKKVRSMVFDTDGTTLYVATEFGFLVLDTTSGIVSKVMDLHRPVNFVAPAPGGMLVSAPGADSRGITAVSCDGGLYLLRDGSTELTELAPTINGDTPTLCNADTGLPATVQFVAPLTAETFLVAGTAGTKRTTFSVCVLRLGADGKGTLCQLSSTPVTSALGIGDTYHNFNLDGCITPWLDGYLATFGDHFLMLRAGIDYDPAETASQYRARAVTSVSRSASRLPSYVSGTQEEYHKTATYDGTDFWFWMGKNGVNSRRLIVTNATTPATTSWTGPTAKLTHNAPLLSEAPYMTYIPDYGMIMRGRGFRFVEDNYSANSPLPRDNICLYSNNKWESLATGWTEKYIPFWICNGATIDPIIQTHIYSTSFFDGIHRINITNQNDLTFFSREGNTRVSNLNGYVKLFSSQPNWAGNVCFSPVTFDNDGTMWTVFDYIYNSGDSKNLHIYYWPAEDRKACENLGTLDADSRQALYEQHPMKRLLVPGYETWHSGELFPLTSEANKNCLVYVNHRWLTEKDLSTTLLIDHNGTPDDPSDDRVFNFFGAYDPDAEVKVNYTSTYNNVVEVPERNSLWIFSQDRIYEAYPQELLNGKPYLYSVKFKGDYPSLPAKMAFDGMTGDIYGRKWLYSYNGGVVCLAPDNETILDYFNSENSPLPCDNVNGVACDPTDGSIWISTAEGLVQFMPEGTESAGGRNRYSVSPTEVPPSYRGYVTFSGLSDSERYSLVDSRGTVVAELGSPKEGVLSWRCTLGATGSYRLVETKAPEAPLLELIVVK